MAPLVLLSQNGGRLKSALQVVLGGHVFAAGLATYLGNESWYRSVVMPAGAWLLDAETAHRWAVQAAALGLMPRLPRIQAPELVRPFY